MSRPLLLIFLLLTGCAISEEREIEIGREAAPQFERQFGGVYPDPAVQTYVHDIGMSLVPQTGRPGLPWQFRVLNADEVNAFALPGGFVYITKGLLFSLENEAQLAGVLGHEAAHVAHRHSVRQLQQAQLLSGGAMIIGLAAGSGLAGDVSSLVAGLALMKYSRGQEREADLSGLKYIARQGYDPSAIVRTMQILARSAGDKRGPPEFLSSHPDPGNREEYLAQRIDQRYAPLTTHGATNEERFTRVVRPRPDAVGNR